MAKRDIAGFLTGLPSGYAETMLKSGSLAGDIMGGRLKGMLGGSKTVGLSPREEMQKGLRNFDNLDAQGKRDLIGRLQASGQTSLAGQLAAQLKTDLQKVKTESDEKTFSTYLKDKYPDSGLDKLADEGIVTPQNLSTFLNKQENKGYTQGKRYTIRDSKGNIFAASTSYGKGDGSFSTIYSALGNTTADKPIGEIEVLTEEGVSFQEKQQAKIETADQIDNNERFSEAQFGAYGAKFEIEENLIGLNETLALLDSVKTGGPIANISGSITKFLGTTPADREELEFRLANRVLGNLKATFGGAITEGERQYLIDISANITKGNKGNRAIIQNLKEIQERAKKRNDLLLSSRNFEEYKNTIKGYNFEDITADSEQENIIDFGDLDNVSNPKR